MIAITKQKTQLELDLELIDAPLKRIEVRTKANASDLNLSLDTFWSLPEDRLLAVLNHHGPVVVNQIFEAHAKYAQGMNELLADRGIGAAAKIGAPREVILNEQGLFELVPLPEPPPIEEPPPEEP